MIESSISSTLILKKIEIEKEESKFPQFLILRGRGYFFQKIRGDFYLVSVTVGQKLRSGNVLGYVVL